MFDNYYDRTPTGTAQPMQPAPWVRPWIKPQPDPLPPLPKPPVQQNGRWKCPDCGHWIANTVLDHACFRPWGWQPQPWPWHPQPQPLPWYTVGNIN